MIKKGSIFKILFVAIFSLSCSKESNVLKNKLTTQFNHSIQQAEAKKFNYQYDGLSPQTSYFVGCKLKFLSLTTNGELSSSTKLVQFENDSIRKIFEIIETYDEENRGSSNFNRRTDRIFTFDFKNKIEKIFLNNQLIEERKISKTTFGRFSHLYRVKKSTEKQFNCKEK